MRFSRRDFLAASAAAMAFPGASRAAAVALPKDAEIVVVGAGAAGIAAARRVLAAGRKVVVVEASDRIGGRCWTDTRTFGVPFDRGAHWIYSQNVNPVARLARSVAMDVYAAPQAQQIRIGRRNARAGETEQFLATLVRTNRAIGEARRSDIAALDAMPRDTGDWTQTLEFLLGPATATKDLKEVSALDLARLEPRDAGAFCRQGLGTLVAKLADAVPIVVGAAATRIVWGARGDLGVETTAGRLSTRAVIVTASTNVLTSGKIRFVPDLPKRYQEAAANLSLGSYDHIALEMPGNPLDLHRDDVIVEKSATNRTAMLLANVGNSPLCIVDVGGSFGRDLSNQGEAAMVAFALEWLAKLYGSDIKAAVKRTAVTRWNASPFVLGAVSAAAPGAQGARKVLADPLGGLILAGEATHETLWGTVGGAWESGERAAEAALRRIGALAPKAREQPARKRPARRSKRRSQ